MKRLPQEVVKEIRRLQELGYSDGEISRIVGVNYSTVHCQRPEVRERRREYKREYYQRPEVKERMREYKRKYYQRPEVRERRREYMREYYQRPEVKERMREYKRKYYQRPEVRERRREYKREYYQRPEDRDFYEVKDLIYYLENRRDDSMFTTKISNNSYLPILKSLISCWWGKKYNQIATDSGISCEKEIIYKLQKLKKIKVVTRNRKRWFLTTKGKELCSYLFENSQLFNEKRKI